MECRTLAAEERRARDRRDGAVAPEAGHRVRGVGQVVHQPVSAVEQVLSDPFSMEKLLRILARRIRNPSEQDMCARWLAERRRHLVADLLCAVDDSRPARGALSPATDAVRQQQAVATVLSSPQATRDVLEVLVERANHGALLDAGHHGIVNAAHRLLQALIDSRTLRPS